MRPIELNHIGSVSEIIINRPEKKNALRDEDFVLFTEIARTVAQSSARCVVVRGASDTFCAGRDIGMTDVRVTDAETLIRSHVNPLFVALRAIPVPTIAAIEGACVGGGFGIGFACDIVLAANDARIGSPFRNIGILPDSGTHFYLNERIGYHRACELIFTGRLISGRQAADMGLINSAYPSEVLLAKVHEMASGIAEGPTMAFRESKQLLQARGELTAVLEAEARGQGDAFRTADAVEGFTAFQQRRRPKFTGA